MRSQVWSIPARQAFLVLASLPLYAYAQNSTIPATTTIPVDTVIDNPVDTPANTPVVESTTQPAVIVPETTTAIFIPDTPVDTPVGESTTEPAVIVPETTTSIFIPDTPVDTPVGESTTEPAVVVPETTTSVFIPDTPVDTPVVESTTELPVDVTTTPEQPVDVTTTTSEAPVDVTTTPEVPVDTTTTAQQPADTTTTDDAATITDAPVLTTATGAAATSSVSSVSTEIIGLIPIINSWKDDPERLKDDTKNTVDGVITDVEGVIAALGGDPKKGCDGKKKRGLLGAIGDIINSLVCIASDLTDISGGIVIGDVTAVTGIISGVQSQTEDLTDENDDDNNSSETDQETTTEEPTSTTSSPCTDDTANHVTIICKPTQVTEDGNVVTTETCYSSITAEITGCSVTEATTVISTTGTEAAITPCASDTCGGADACPMDELPLSGADMNYVSTSVDCGAISTITTSELPTGYGTLNDIAVAEPTPHSDDTTAAKRSFGDNTSPDPLYVAGLAPVWVSQLGDASGHWFNYPETGQGFVGVNGIYGCTAVIIASEKGVYLSHIWENPVFIDSDWAPTSDESFNSNAFEALRDGTPFAQSVTALIGDDANPGVLNAIYAPKVFVLTPFTTANDPTGITTNLRYQDRAQKLANDLAGVIPGSGGSGYLLGYTRTNQELSTMEPGWLGRAIFEVDVLQSVLVTPHAPDGSLRVGRWRLWVEDQLITYQDFWIPDHTGNLKRQDDGADACLVQGSSTGTTTAEVTSTAVDSTTPGAENTETTTPGIESTETTQSIETSAEPATETPVESTTEILVESTTEATSTEAAEPTSTTDLFNTPTTLLTSVLTTTSAPGTTSDEETTTAVDTYTGPYYCVNHGGPNVATPYCQCSTTTAGQTFFASAPLISAHCTDYTSYPADVTLQPTDVVTEAPDPTPWVTTEDNGAIISYPDQTVNIGAVGTIKYTHTVGEGTPVTIRPADATQTDSNNKGSSQCHSIDDACDRAVAEFEDDFIYTEFASYYTRIKKGIIIVATFGQAGCVVEYDCDDWSQGGMNGKQIKDAYQYMKDNDGVSKCGTNYLSNTCHVTSNYCTNCNERHQDLD
ncbi:hypothetical protein B0J13DRAFT_35988 [Dactylonectria estremocensis]|uniref:Uncharacterized protein n=1 Tax=Dactylonectria estremocensis TaxID=1079267 RepID=A0A9P9FJK5_9HYPO|nr:hypothetical protein B0J13DRAFT_35988 [Dactylonectria estremocensis]